MHRRGEGDEWCVSGVWWCMGWVRMSEDEWSVVVGGEGDEWSVLVHGRGKGDKWSVVCG